MTSSDDEADPDYDHRTHGLSRIRELRRDPHARAEERRDTEPQRATATPSRTEGPDRNQRRPDPDPGYGRDRGGRRRVSDVYAPERERFRPRQDTHETHERNLQLRGDRRRIGSDATAGDRQSSTSYMDPRDSGGPRVDYPEPERSYVYERSDTMESRESQRDPQRPYSDRRDDVLGVRRGNRNPHIYGDPRGDVLDRRGGVQPEGYRRDQYRELERTQRQRELDPPFDSRGQRVRDPVNEPPRRLRDPPRPRRDTSDDAEERGERRAPVTTETTVRSRASSRDSFYSRRPSIASSIMDSSPFQDDDRGRATTETSSAQPSRSSTDRDSGRRSRSREGYSSRAESSQQSSRSGHTGRHEEPYSDPRMSTERSEYPAYAPRSGIDPPPESRRRRNRSPRRRRDSDEEDERGDYGRYR